MAKEYLFAVQTSTGHEVVSWSGEVEKVGDVTARIKDEKSAEIYHGGELVAAGQLDVELESPVLHRWPADDKLSAPVSHPVK